MVYLYAHCISDTLVLVYFCIAMATLDVQMLFFSCKSIGLCNAYVNHQIYLCMSSFSGQRKPEYWLRDVVLIAASALTGVPC